MAGTWLQRCWKTRLERSPTPLATKNASVGASKCEVWALGVVVFELLSAVRPFVAEAPIAMYGLLRHAELDLEPVWKAEVSAEAAGSL